MDLFMTLLIGAVFLGVLAGAFSLLVIVVVRRFNRVDEEPTASGDEFAADFDALQAERAHLDAAQRARDAEQMAVRAKFGPLRDGSEL